MADRICSLCEVPSYTDEEGPHPYTDCVKRLNEQTNMAITLACRLNHRLLEARKRADSERSQRR